MGVIASDISTVQDFRAGSVKVVKMYRDIGNAGDKGVGAKRAKGVVGNPKVVPPNTDPPLPRNPRKDGVENTH